MNAERPYFTVLRAARCPISARRSTLHLETSFFDARVDPEVKRARETDRRAREQQRARTGRELDALREAEHLIQSARDIDIAPWRDDHQLHAALNTLAKAYQLVETGARGG